MERNRPKNVVLHLDPAPESVCGGLEGLYAGYVRRLLAESGLSARQKLEALDRAAARLRQRDDALLPLGKGRKSPVAGDKIVGNDGDEPLPGRVDDPATHNTRRVTAESHAH